MSNPFNISSIINSGFSVLGLDKNKENYKVVIDRREAIKEAIEIAQKDDIVIIAGKGHENYQIIGKVKHHFDDKEIAQEFLNNK